MEGNKIRMGGKKELIQLRGIFVQIGSFWRLLKVGGQFYNIEGFLSLLISFPFFLFLFFSHQNDVVLITPNLSSLPEGRRPDEGTNRSTMVKRNQDSNTVTQKQNDRFAHFHFSPIFKTQSPFPTPIKSHPSVTKILNL